jgi:hypothetical protein
MIGIIAKIALNQKDLINAHATAIRDPISLYLTATIGLSFFF